MACVCLSSQLRRMRRCTPSIACSCSKRNSYIGFDLGFALPVESAPALHSASRPNAALFLSQRRAPGTLARSHDAVGPYMMIIRWFAPGPGYPSPERRMWRTAWAAGGNSIADAAAASESVRAEREIVRGRGPLVFVKSGGVSFVNSSHSLQSSSVFTLGGGGGGGSSSSSKQQQHHEV